MLSGCCGGDEIMIKSTFYGGVTVTPLDVNNGDAITLKMGEFCGVISTESSVNGKNIVKSITYFIDGKEIVSSSDKDADYVATYILKDMTVGEHEITAHVIRIKEWKLKNTSALRELMSSNNT